MLLDANFRERQFLLLDWLNDNAKEPLKAFQVLMDMVLHLLDQYDETEELHKWVLDILQSRGKVEMSETSETSEVRSFNCLNDPEHPLDVNDPDIDPELVERYKLISMLDDWLRDNTKDPSQAFQTLTCMVICVLKYDETGEWLKDALRMLQRSRLWFKKKKEMKSWVKTPKGVN